jgi:hypothetical protein
MVFSNRPGRLKRLAIELAITVALLSLPASVFIAERHDNRRADDLREQRVRDCAQDRRAYDTLRALITETTRPGPTLLDQLDLPPDTPSSVISILTQLSEPPEPGEVQADLHRYIALLGEPPSC